MLFNSSSKVIKLISCIHNVIYILCYAVASNSITYFFTSEKAMSYVHL